MMIRSIHSEILVNDTASPLKNLFFITGKIKLIKLLSHFLITAYLGKDGSAMKWFIP